MSFAAIISGSSGKMAVATGNWGCGDTHLKAVLQLMAAALAKRYIVYFTFGDDKLAKDISQIHQLFVDQDLDVATVWSLLLRYHKEVVGQAKANRQTLRGGVVL